MSSGARSLSMQTLLPESGLGIPGDIAPTGFFDPLGLSNGKDEDTIKMYREAEIKHGRVCMLASAGILTQELLKNPLGIDGPGIYHWDAAQKVFPEFGFLFLLLTAFIEGGQIVKYYETASEARAEGRNAILKADSEPGDLGWDPLGWYPEDPEEQAIIRTKEIQNGRLAMLSFLGIVAQELTDGKEVLCHFQKVCA